jgi:hypothetical protein
VPCSLPYGSTRAGILARARREPGRSVIQGRA